MEKKNYSPNMHYWVETLEVGICLVVFYKSIPFCHSGYNKRSNGNFTKTKLQIEAEMIRISECFKKKKAS